MIEGKTSTGFKFSYDERLLTDWRIMEAISTADSPYNNKMVKGTTDLINFLLGDQKDGLMEHIKKSNDGFIPVDKLRKELFEILGASKESKN